MLAAIFQLPVWVWVALTGIAIAGCVVIGVVVAQAFVTLRETRDAVAASRDRLVAALEATKLEAERAKEGFERLAARKTAEAEPDAFRDW